MNQGDLENREMASKNRPPNTKCFPLRRPAHEGASEKKAGSCVSKSCAGAKKIPKNVQAHYENVKNITRR